MKKYLVAVWLCALTILATQSVSLAASFDCRKAATVVERVICGSEELSRLDESLEKAYQRALGNADHEKDTIRSQRQWLKNERNLCKTEQCLKKAYEERIAELSLSSYNAEDKSVSIDFSGQWHLDLCDKSISQQCGGFTVYLIQRENRLCGDYYFATPGLARLNEGEPRSITGTVRGDVADILISSERNGAVFKVQAIKKGNVLNWKIIEEVKPGIEGESALVLDKGNLKRQKKSKQYQDTLSACQNNK